MNFEGKTGYMFTAGIPVPGPLASSTICTRLELCAGDDAGRESAEERCRRYAASDSEREVLDDTLVRGGGGRFVTSTTLLRTGARCRGAGSGRVRPVG